MKLRRAMLVVPFAIGLTAGALPEAPAQAATANVIVQGGTTIRDSGLLANVITPGFQSMFPQYRLLFIAVGTSQALTNAEAGQGDAVFTHDPEAEAQFVSAGYSYERYGRAIMVSDFITVGTTGDAAGVAIKARHDAVGAFEAIAAAGAAGNADFVSRGDASGTNLKELDIWALVHLDDGLSLNNNGEPGPAGSTLTATWYHKAGLGQASTLQVANQCPFSSHHCYAIADRGTFNYLVGKGTLTNLSLVSDRNVAPAPGGTSLLVNPYHAYAVDPAKNPQVNLPGALAFLDYLVSPQFQAAVAAYPSTTNPAFTPDARPTISITRGLPPSATGGVTLTVTGGVHPNFPLSPQLVGAPVDLVGAKSRFPVATTRLDGRGNYTFRFLPTRTDSYQVVFPAYRDRQSTSLGAGPLSVTGKVTLHITGASGATLNLSGLALPARGRRAARVLIEIGRPSGTLRAAKVLTLRSGTTAWSTSITLPGSGAWLLRAEYKDPGVVRPGTSAKMPVSV
jgi:tungstate transport system substrate-binding protein